MSQPHTYQTSRDYERLCEEMKTRRIVCFVNYPASSIQPTVDVVATRFDPSSTHPYDAGTRGIGYICAATAEEFREACAHLNLEWIP